MLEHGVNFKLNDGSVVRDPCFRDSKEGNTKPMVPYVIEIPILRTLGIA